jgi:serine acetyltransferase
MTIAKKSYPLNEYIKNGRIAELYLLCLRRKWHVLGKCFGLLLNCQIGCRVPERLFIPHPSGIIVDSDWQIHNDVVLLQQVTLGAITPYVPKDSKPDEPFPILGEGVYVGPGAKLLGHITVGEWSVIGANAVVTISVPPYSIVVGHNRILEKKSTQLLVGKGGSQ